MATHYDTLGVSPLAGVDEIRRAYVELARRVHPDRQAQADARRMQEVNEAWRVLRDPARRAAYDRSLASVSAPPEPDTWVDPLDVPFVSPPVEPGDIGMAIVRAAPWVAILVVLFAIFVFTAFATGGGGDDGPASLEGRCVATRAGTMVAVPCDGPNEGRVRMVVLRSAYCPDATTPSPAEDGFWLCVDEPKDAP